MNRKYLLKQRISAREMRMRRKEVRAIILKGLRKYTRIKLNRAPPAISPMLSRMYNFPAVNVCLVALITANE